MTGYSIETRQGDPQPTFGDEELVDFYVGQVIVYAYSAQYGRDPIQYLTEVAEKIREEERPDTAIRVQEHYAGLPDASRLARQVGRHSVTFNDSTGLQQKLLRQLDTFLALPEDRKGLFVIGISIKEPYPINISRIFGSGRNEPR